MKNQSRFGLFLMGIALLIALPNLHATAAPLSTIVVTNNLDNTTSGNGCSLREAIINSNNNAATHPDCVAGLGKDNILFNIAGGGTQTINIKSSPLPEITDAVTIDATTQPGCSKYPCIELNGSAAGSNANGFAISAGNTVIRGFVINQFSANGIELFNGDSNRVQGNFIGTDVTGTAARPNADNGIAIGSNNNIVGGTTASARNLISANAGYGVAIGSAANGNNIVQGNFIGTDVNGTNALGNGAGGVTLSFGANHNTIGGTSPGARNLISGNSNNGILLIDDNTNFNSVVGNYIGTDVYGTTALPNQAAGVAAKGGRRNTIGGLDALARNVISGNGSDGVLIEGSDVNSIEVLGNYIGTDVTGAVALGNVGQGVHIVGASFNGVGSPDAVRNVISGNEENGIQVEGSTATENFITNNFIGTDSTGKRRVPNFGYGIRILDAPQNKIVGYAPDAVNVVSANSGGIVIQDSQATGNVIVGNYVGTDVTGAENLGNQFSGVQILGAADTMVGEDEPGYGNIIAFNVNGVTIETDPGKTAPVGNAVIGNSIHDNEFLGIDLGGNLRVLPNDTQDPDTGVNKFQNYPMLTSAQNVGPKIHITGSLDSATNNSAYPIHIEFFSNPACDDSGYGEGQTMLGAASVTTPGTFVFDLPTNVPDGSQVTATATDDDGNTSEFSACIPAQSAECSAVPAAPSLLRPAQGSSSTKRRVALDWSDVKCAKHYKVIVKKGAKVGKNVERQAGLAISQTTTARLERGALYFWRVRACNDEGCGPWSPFAKFRVAQSATQH